MRRYMVNERGSCISEHPDGKYVLYSDLAATHPPQDHRRSTGGEGQEFLRRGVEMNKDRCELCGSWDAQCSSDEPIKGCGCVRCASHRIIQLERDLAAAQADVREHIALCLKANKLVDEARAEAAAFKADAERYRWLKDRKNGNAVRYVETYIEPDDLDAAIDAARGGGK